jgi:SAM-dependent methyltransferase
VTGEAQPEGRAIFGSRAADYASARPSYPRELFLRLRAEVIPAGGVVADIGAGTGLFTRDLLGIAATVHAVEPNAEMRAAAVAALGGIAGFRAVDGSAEATGLADASVDVVTAAQAFHWFDPAAAALEFRRILRPGGQAVLVWNERLRGDPLQVALDEILDGLGGPGRIVVHGYEDHDRTRAFFAAPPAEWEVPYEQVLTREGLKALVFSRSYMPARDTEAGHEAARRTDAVFDAFGREGLVVVRYTTSAFVGEPASG